MIKLLWVFTPRFPRVSIHGNGRRECGDVWCGGFWRPGSCFQGAYFLRSEQWQMAPTCLRGEGPRSRSSAVDQATGTIYLADGEN
jgi:hypothetical protein